MKFNVLTTLNPNAINERYGRPASDCDVARQADSRDVVEAESAEKALELVNGEDFPDYGYPERLFHSVVAA